MRSARGVPAEPDSQSQRVSVQPLSPFPIQNLKVLASFPAIPITFIAFSLVPLHFRHRYISSTCVSLVTAAALRVLEDNKSKFN